MTNGSHKGTSENGRRLVEQSDTRVQYCSKEHTHIPFLGTIGTNMPVFNTIIRCYHYQLTLWAEFIHFIPHELCVAALHSRYHASGWGDASDSYTCASFESLSATGAQSVTPVVSLVSLWATVPSRGVQFPDLRLMTRYPWVTEPASTRAPLSPYYFADPASSWWNWLITMNSQ